MFDLNETSRNEFISLTKHKNMILFAYREKTHANIMQYSASQLKQYFKPNGFKVQIYIYFFNLKLNF